MCNHAPETECVNVAPWCFRLKGTAVSAFWDQRWHRPGRVRCGILAALFLVGLTPLWAQEESRPVPDGQTPNIHGQAEKANSPSNEDADAAPSTSAASASAPQNPPAPQTPTPAPGPTGNAAAKPSPVSKWIGSEVIATLPPPIYQQKLTPNDKFQIYVYQNYGPQNFIVPAFSAAFAMVRPPRGYPRPWLDGGGAFGRWYGAQFVSSTSNRTARLMAQLAFHEDPRYVPSGSKNVLIRISNALMFTIVDKTDSGRNTFAFSNFAGAAAGGLVGMSFYPDGHNDVVHAEQRALRGLETIAVRNIVTEFRPEWEPVLKRIHIPQVLPAWWTRQPAPVP